MSYKVCSALERDIQKFLLSLILFDCVRDVGLHKDSVTDFLSALLKLECLILKSQMRPVVEKTVASIQLLK